MQWRRKKIENAVIGSAKHVLLFRRYSCYFTEDDGAGNASSEGPIRASGYYRSRREADPPEAADKRASAPNATPDAPKDPGEEYTKIITPRQDMLFKRSYLNKRRHGQHNEQENEQPIGENGEYYGPEEEYLEEGYPSPGHDPNGVYLANGPGTYEVYDPYTGSFHTVLAYNTPPNVQPLLATIPVHPLPQMQPMQFYNAPPHEWITVPQYPMPPLHEEAEELEQEQEGGPQNEEGDIVQRMANEHAPVEVEEAIIPNYPSTPPHHPSYVYPGHMFGSPIYNINGVNVQYCGQPNVVPLEVSDPNTELKKRKKRRRRKRGEAEDECDSSSEEYYNKSAAGELEVVVDEAKEVIEDQQERENVENVETASARDENERLKAASSAGLNVYCEPYVSKAHTYEAEHPEDKGELSEGGSNCSHSDSGISSPNSDISHCATNRNGTYKLPLQDIKLSRRARQRQNKIEAEKAVSANAERPQEREASGKDRAGGSNHEDKDVKDKNKGKLKNKDQKGANKERKNSKKDAIGLDSIVFEIEEVYCKKKTAKDNASDKILTDVTPPAKQNRNKKAKECGARVADENHEGTDINDSSQEKSASKSPKCSGKAPSFAKTTKKYTKVAPKSPDGCLTAVEAGRKNNDDRKSVDDLKNNTGGELFGDQPTSRRRKNKQKSQEMSSLLSCCKDQTTEQREREREGENTPPGKHLRKYVQIADKPVLAKLVALEKYADEEKVDVGFTHFSSCRENIVPKAPPRKKKSAQKLALRKASAFVDDIVQEAASRVEKRHADLPITLAVTQWLMTENGNNSFIREEQEDDEIQTDEETAQEEMPTQTANANNGTASNGNCVAKNGAVSLRKRAQKDSCVIS